MTPHAPDETFLVNDVTILAAGETLLTALRPFVELAQPLLALYTSLHRDLEAARQVPSLRLQVDALREEIASLEARKHELTAAQQRERLQQLMPWPTQARRN